MGFSPISDQILTKDQLDEPEATYPVTVNSCRDCGFCQLGFVVEPELMYNENYSYDGSATKGLRQHHISIANQICDNFQLDHNSLVIDIGSNDGTFLSFFGKNFNLIGVDPTIKKFAGKYNKNIEKVPEFFLPEVVNKYINKKKAKLITSIAMFYDLEDPLKFVKDIYECLDEKGIWHFEQSYMPSMIKNISYDTICHEHLEYYSLKSVKYLLDQVGFSIIDIELNSINGGSFALTVAKKKSGFTHRSSHHWI